MTTLVQSDLIYPRFTYEITYLLYEEEDSNATATGNEAALMGA